MDHEIATLQLLGSKPRLLQYYGCGFQDDQGFIVTEYAPHHIIACLCVQNLCKTCAKQEVDLPCYVAASAG